MGRFRKGGAVTRGSYELGNVIQITGWGNRTPDTAIKKLLSCDRFIRSRFLPPPMGNVVFNFSTGKATVSRECTVISGDDCEVIIRGDDVQIIGSTEHATELFCSIHREIETLNLHGLASA